VGQPGLARDLGAAASNYAAGAQMKTGDVLIVIGAVLLAFVLAGFVFDRDQFGRIPQGDNLVLMFGFAAGVGFVSSGLFSNYRR
jgi:hypothetical protein